ncbi:hypothetical protein [Nisaea sp.]|uniref:hypothetical protein n=1 Tax=Nisaea sp. TaxID=2024842 RepID=UPI0032F03307
MMQDVSLGVTTTITQADIPVLRAAGRLGEYAVVYRSYRQQQGGGFGDQEKHPFAWGVLAYVDTQLARVYSARGLPREWTDLTRLEKWMREQGFWYWWMRNDLEPLSMTSPEDESEAEDEPAVPPIVRQSEIDVDPLRAGLPESRDGYMQPVSSQLSQMNADND